jgi:hypothetical protein
MIYDAVRQGAGTGTTYRPYSLPEWSFERLALVPLLDGDARHYSFSAPEWVEVQK